MAEVKKVLVQGVEMVLVPRAQLELRQAKRAIQPRGPLPVPPPTFDWSNGRRIKFPILGNNRVGDCFYTTMAHDVQAKLGMNGPQVEFDENKLVARYLVVAGGDNGMTDDQIFPEYKMGIIGPAGPHKILDHLVINHNDDAMTAFCMWAFCGAGYTCALLNTWLQNPQPGQTWDSGGHPDPMAGHAMLMTGRNARGGYDLQTWGFDPPVNLTTRGLKSAQPEVFITFSLEMFNAAGYAPCGLHYVTLAPIWKQLGGIQLPPNPFPAPSPGPGPDPDPPGPVPIPPQKFTVNVPQQPVYSNWGTKIGYVPAHVLTGTIQPSKAEFGAVHIMLPPWILPLLSQACAGAVHLPGVWGMLLPFLCKMIPTAPSSTASGVSLALPPWAMVILRMACSQAGELPPPYDQIALAFCSLLPHAPAGEVSGITGMPWPEETDKLIGPPLKPCGDCPEPG